jgi:hypothetical protein
MHNGAYHDEHRAGGRPDSGGDWGGQWHRVCNEARAGRIDANVVVMRVRVARVSSWQRLKRLRNGTCTETSNVYAVKDIAPRPPRLRDRSRVLFRTTMRAGLCHTRATRSDSGHAPSGALHPWFHERNSLRLDRLSRQFSSRRRRGWALPQLPVSPPFLARSAYLDTPYRYGYRIMCDMGSAASCRCQ